MGILKYTMVVVFALAAGCAAQASRHDSEFEPAPESVRQGWEVTKSRCSSCHELDRIFLNMYLYEDRGDVELLVEDMASRPGSGIGEDDTIRIVETLDWYREKP